MKSLVVVITGLLLATPALAQGEGGGSTGSGGQMAAETTETPENGASTAGEGEGGERRICRRVETPTGSRMPYRRMCMTADQWRSFNRNN
jgi:hypothetical protein